jgi:hypothetical protein
MRQGAMTIWLAFALAPGFAAAATLDVAVVDAKGMPVADAVVSVLPVAGFEAGAGNPRTHTIDQHALRFDPYLEIMRPGDTLFMQRQTLQNFVHRFLFAA